MATDHKINIQTYFTDRFFKIPHYQRGYKWGVKSKEEKSSVDYFCDSLLDAFKRGDQEYFIEAVTVVQECDQAILVDGQQRTITLFLLFFALEDFNFLKNIKIDYQQVRKDSHDFLMSLRDKKMIVEKDVQDIYYFKVALQTIKDKLDGFSIDKDGKLCDIKSYRKKINEKDKTFAEFIKENIFLLLNKIPLAKAVNTFIAMNGLKAIMKDEELIKSDLLIKSSRIEENLPKPNSAEENLGVEWKINEDRGCLARNWDKWLYWWNQEQIKLFFGTGKNYPLHYLLVTYWNLNKGDCKEDFSFDNFKNKFITNAKNAKNNFEGLRKIQKTFEDLYNDADTYNLLGLSLNINIEKEQIIQFFIKNSKDKLELTRFSKWAIIGCTFDEINTNKIEKFNDKKRTLKEKLLSPNLYESDAKNQVYLQLLRMNVVDMNNRKFDFEIFKTKSLEHICPQNPPPDDIEFIKTKDDINKNSDGINSIGNLVLLNGPTNSGLSNNPLIIKKMQLFNKIKEGFLLPHTLKVFSKSFSTEENKSLFDNEKYWVSENVKSNKIYFINQFDEYYREK